jgi:TolB-like protein
MDRKAQARASGRLDSWKEIAAYLRRGARTVQRWEREEGLPVRRLQHAKLGSVYAFRHELDAWFEGRGEANRRAADSASIAVLPFDDLSAERDQAYFCEGLAEEVRLALNGVEGLRTASRASTVAVRWRLVGSVRRSGDRIRVTAQLVDAENGFQVWADRYDRTMGDLLDVQDGIAASVARAVQRTVAESEDLAA